MTGVTKLPKAALLSINDARGVLTTYSVYVVLLSSGNYRGVALDAAGRFVTHTPAEHGTTSEAFSDISDRLWFYHDHPACPSASTFDLALASTP
jgi:hypothetical protein